MKIRIEFLDAKSMYRTNTVRICKKLGTYKCDVEDGLTVHSVTFEGGQIASFDPVWNMVRGWKGSVVYVNDQLVDMWGVWNALRIWRDSNENPHPKSQIMKFLQERPSWQIDPWNN